MTEALCLWQMGSVRAVGAGLTAACVSVGEALRHGDVGFARQEGTTDPAVFVNGVCYRIGPSCQAVAAGPKEGLCLCLVAPFDHYAPVFLESGVDTLDGLGAILDQRPEVAKKRNHPQLMVGAGTLGRAVLSGPRAPQAVDDQLSDAALGKTVVQVSDVSGTIVGRRIPTCVVPDESGQWCYTFVSEDHRLMGWLLGASSISLACQIGVYDGITLCLPDLRAYDEMDLDEKARI
ncbi:MAG: acetolactate decarboxylase [Atopobiaceae bacterium]